ncbi:5-hydroxytryptamine receptor 2A isoform X2 [Cephus cinctus]|uniref:5-hydroxytryptamine receptor 2A isoform X2 n=1 Tax=Cephus cinctus TaxID=211228 RepID=A0AAJ7R9Y2_CEPCN|nr:5-hydroxytryptamine receptor 2A isoform X2 [Cephus cinctus]
MRLIRDKMLEYWMANNASGANGSEFEIEEVLEDPGSAMLFSGYPAWILYFAAGCCVLFMFIGIPGNLITVAALFRTKKLRNATAVFIMNLSVSDLMFCCFNLPLATSTFWHGSWLHGPLLCRLFPLLRYGLVAVSLFTVLAITINRYVMIGHPRLYPKLYKPKYLALMVLATWTLGFGALVATWFGQWGRFGLDPSIGSCSILPDVNGRSPKEFLFIVAFLTPCIAIVVCYARIFYIVRRTAMKSRRNKITTDLIKANLEVRYTKNFEDSAIGSSCGATLTTTENGSSPTRTEKVNFLGSNSPRFSPSYHQGCRNTSNFEYGRQTSKLNELHYGQNTVKDSGEHDQNENGNTVDGSNLKRSSSKGEGHQQSRSQNVKFYDENSEEREDEAASGSRENSFRKPMRNGQQARNRYSNDPAVDGNSIPVENPEKQARENDGNGIRKNSTTREQRHAAKNQSVTFGGVKKNSGNFENFIIDNEKGPSPSLALNASIDNSENVETGEESYDTAKSNLDSNGEDIPFIDTSVQTSSELDSSFERSKTQLAGPEIRLEDASSPRSQQILNLESLEVQNKSTILEDGHQLPRKYLNDLEYSSENLLSPQTIRYDEISEDYTSSRSESPSERRPGRKSNVFNRESRFRSMRARTFETGKMTAKDKKLLKMILVIFSSFLICYLPITITKTFRDVIDWRGLNIAGYILIYLTTCINPVIYVVMSSEYRSAYKNVLLCRSDSIATTSRHSQAAHVEKKKNSD